MKFVKGLKYNSGVSRISKFIGKENLEKFENNEAITIKKEYQELLLKRNWIEEVKEEDK